MLKKPMPTIDSDSDEYWNGAKSNKLMLRYSKDKNEYFLYSRILGNASEDDNLIWKQVSGEGEVYSYTEVHTPAGPAFEEDVPYIVALIQLKEGTRIISNIVIKGNEKIKIGDKVKVFFDKVSDELTIPKFKKVESN